MPLLIITLWLKFQIGSKNQYFASRDCYAKFFGKHEIKLNFATVIGSICHIDFARLLIFCVGYNGQGQLSQQLFNSKSQAVLKLMQIKLKTEYKRKGKLLH